MRYPVYPAFTPRITQRLPSREGPRAGVETRERSDEQNMWRFLEARWRDWRLILHLKFSAAHYPPSAQRLPQGTVELLGTNSYQWCVARSPLPSTTARSPRSQRLRVRTARRRAPGDCGLGREQI